MKTQISPMLAVSDPTAAIEFYTTAFGAVLRWQIGEPAGVAGMSIDGADFFLADESPQYGTRSPDGAGHTTVRIELFVDDPHAVHARAIEAGARARSSIEEHAYPTVNGTMLRMIQGSVTDPFGHVWLIGRFLD